MKYAWQTRPTRVERCQDRVAIPGNIFLDVLDVRERRFCGMLMISVCGRRDLLFCLLQE